MKLINVLYVACAPLITIASNPFPIVFAFPVRPYEIFSREELSRIPLTLVTLRIRTYNAYEGLHEGIGNINFPTFVLDNKQY
jgi:hypothetical protein